MRELSVYRLHSSFSQAVARTLSGTEGASQWGVIDAGFLQQYPMGMYLLDRGNIELLKMEGPDAKDFLHRLSTQNFKAPIQDSLHGAFLDGQAKFISLFTAWETKGEIFLFTEKEMFKDTFDYLNKMHFSEKLKIEKFKAHCTEIRSLEPIRIAESVKAYNWGLHGAYIFDKFHSDLGMSAQKITFEEYDALRASYGFPKPKKDLTKDHVLIEAGLDDLVDRSKGCYPGQEVIEKIYTYGRISKKILKIEFASKKIGVVEFLKTKLPFVIEKNNERVGVITTLYLTPNSCFGFATLKRLYYEKNSVLDLEIEKETLQAKIILD